MGISRQKIMAGAIYLAIILGLVLFLRSPYVSNALKKIALKELNTVTAYQITSSNMYINLFPVFVGLNNIKAADDNGDIVFSAEKIKAYLDLSTLLDKGLIIDRVVLLDPSFNVTSEKISELKQAFDKRKKASENDTSSKKVKVDIYTIVLEGADISYEHLPGQAGQAVITVTDADVEIHLKEGPTVEFSVNKIAMEKEKWPHLSAAVRGVAVIEEEAIRFEYLTIDSHGSHIEASADIRRNAPSVITLDATVLEKTVKKIFDLKTPGDGTVHAKGTVTIDPKPIDSSLDLDLDGSFHLETLIGALRVNTSFELEGDIDFSGHLSGPITKMEGEARGSMKEAALFGLYPDRVQSIVRFNDNVLSFHEMEADLYGGKAAGHVYFSLPRITNYFVDIDFKDAGSGPLDKLINIGWLNLPDGRVDGNFHASGLAFAPRGNFSYSVVEGREDPIGRVQSIRGNFSMVNKVLVLNDIHANSADSNIFFNGIVDLNTSGLDFNGTIQTSELNSLLSPYLDMVSGTGRIDISAGGTIEQPVIDARLNLKDVSIENYMFGDLKAHALATRSALKILDFNSTFKSSSHVVDGEIAYDNKQYLPNLEDLEYDFSIKSVNGSLGDMYDLVGLGTDINGIHKTVAKFKGKGRAPVISGHAFVTNGVAFGREFQQADFGYLYENETFTLTDGVFDNKSSSVLLDGNISQDRSFSFKASSTGLSFKKFAHDQELLDYKMDMKMTGSGTLDQPLVVIDGLVTAGVYRGYPLFDAKVKGLLNGTDYSFNARSIDKVTGVDVSGSLSPDRPWRAELDLGYGRYDYLLGPFIKTPPKDLSLGLLGKVSLWGTKDALNMDVNLERVLVNAFGQGFNNLKDINFTYRDGLLTVSESEFRGGNSVLSFSGTAHLDKMLDLKITGHTTLLPLPYFVPMVGSAKGNAALDMQVKGTWDKPLFSGTVQVNDGGLSLKGRPQRISGINGIVRFADGRGDVENISATIGGGRIVAAGNFELAGLRPYNLRMDMVLSDISLYISRNIIAKIGGNVLLTGDSKAQKLIGELWIKSALYSERVDWKTWLSDGRKSYKARKPGGWLSRVGLNVRMFGDKNIKVKNNLADASLTVDIVIRGTLDAPVILGRVESGEGKVFFRNTQFTVIQAIADYQDATSTLPYISIRAQSSVSGYHIWLSLEGKADQMDMTLSSDPPLDDADILTLLTLGGSGGSLDGLEGGIGAAEATSFLTGDVQDVVEERFADITGLDRVHIAPAVSSETGTVVPKVSVSKRLFGDKLFVTYSSTLGDENEQEMKLEYMIDESLSVLGGQEDTGSVGGDLKFRFRFE
jgi:translocation and assembly module TamB